MTSVTDAWLGDPVAHPKQKEHHWGQAMFGAHESFYSRQSGKLCDEIETSCTNIIHSASCKCGGEMCCDFRGHLCLPKMNLLQSLHCCYHFYEIDSNVTTSEPLPCSFIPDVPKDKIQHPSSGDIPFLSSNSSLHGTPIEIVKNPEIVPRTSNQPDEDYYMTSTTSATNIQTHPSKTKGYGEGNAGAFKFIYDDGENEADANNVQQKDEPISPSSSKDNPKSDDHQSALAVNVNPLLEPDVSVIYRNFNPTPKKSCVAAGFISDLSLETVEDQIDNDLGNSKLHD